jgi:AcrR family transcriptional regulator
VAAAHRSFVEKGYGATTIEDVAALAGVSRPTVFVSVGGKPELLRQARDIALAGDDADVPVPQRPQFVEMWREPDRGRTLELYARNLSEMNARAADIEAVLQAAAHADPEVSELAAEALRQRRLGAGLVIDSILQKGALRQGLSRAAAGDILFTLAGPETYRQLTGTCGWSPRHYQRWLAATFRRELLGDKD